MTELSIEEFYHGFMQELYAGADADNKYLEQEFSEKTARDLMDAGIIEDFQVSHWKAPKGQRVDGYWFNEDDATLDLFIVDFTRNEELLSLTKTDVTAIINRLRNFFIACAEKSLHMDGLDETSEGYALAKNIADRKNSFSKVNFYLLSERRLSDRVKAIEEEQHGRWLFSTHIWDMSRLYRLNTSKGTKEEIWIDFNEDGIEGLPCLPAHTGSDLYESYLVAIPGTTLCDLYGRYGARLLEQNVRCFLQARGNVNKGIKATILNEPDMFFAYNNGITATAKEVVTEDKDSLKRIVKIKDLQIVNGGQTTASLYHTHKKDKANLEKVFVQMKLSLVDDKRAEEIVPLISEYANTQNKVNAADFFSNHPFHMRVEDFSRRIWSPVKSGEIRETKWFYERARGQFADAQSNLTQGEKKRFLMENPKAQMFTKTDLAKFENVWEDKPQIVNLGAQKNFAKFASRMGKSWKKKENYYNEHYYKRLIARAIIFRRTEKIVSAQDWYQGGYRANIVAYTIGMIAAYCVQKGKSLDFINIWKNQDIGTINERAIELVARIVHDDITQPPPHFLNVGEWCKKEQCWERLLNKLRQLDDVLSDDFKSSLLDIEQEKNLEKEGKTTQAIDNGVELQAFIVGIPSNKWIELRAACADKKLLTGKEDGCLKIACGMPRSLPSEKQCQVLLEVIDKAKLEGITID